MRLLAFFMLFILIVMGCYRPDEDEDFRTVPTTNNPTLIQDKNSKTPGMGY